MLDFMIVWTRKELPQLSDEAFIAKLQEIRPVKTDSSTFWQPPLCSDMHVWVWGTEVAPYKIADQLVQNYKGLSFMNGWVMPALGRAPVQRVSDVRASGGDAAQLHGEFVLANIDNRGNGSLRRNLFASSPVYYHEGAQCTVIASRAGLVSAFLRHDFTADIDADFVRWGVSSAVCLNQASMHKQVSILPQGASVSFKSGRPKITLASGDLFRRDALAELYRNDSVKFWDQAFERLLGLTHAVNVTDAPLDLMLSGSKDSRLMLAILQKAGLGDCIRKITVNGADENPDVVVAREICKLYDVPLEVNFNPNAKPAITEPLTERMLAHLKFSEGEMSPADIFWRTDPKYSVNLPINEVGVRNIAGQTSITSREELKAWFDAHLGKYDVCGYLHASAKAANAEEVEAYISKCEKLGIDYAQVPTYHRLESRMARWNARLWSASNALQFSPFLFQSEDVVLYTYNAGATSRAKEEFFFEMLKRCEPKLLEIPLTHQGWSKELLAGNDSTQVAQEPIVWNEQLKPAAHRPVHMAMYHHFDEIKEYIAANAGDAITSVVDLERLRKMRIAGVQAKHMVPLWQLLQLTVAGTIKTNDPAVKATLPQLDLHKVETVDLDKLIEKEMEHERIKNKVSRIAILGSCVSRDIFDLAPIDKAQVTRYVARTSLCSMFAPPIAEPTDAMKASEKWRERMMVLELTNQSIPYLFSQPCDYVLVDFVDERLGVVRNGNVCTSMAPFHEFSGFPDINHPDYIKLMPMHKGYVDLWRKGLVKLVEAMEAYGMSDKIILNKVYLSATTKEGVALPQVSQDYVQNMNKFLEEVYGYFQEAFPQARCIEYPKGMICITNKHQRDVAAFHYDTCVYEHAAQVIASCLSDSEPASVQAFARSA